MNANNGDTTTKTSLQYHSWSLVCLLASATGTGSYYSTTSRESRNMGSLRDQEEYLYIKICDFLTKGLSNHSSKELHKKGTSHNEHVNPSQYYFYGKNHKS